MKMTNDESLLKLINGEKMLREVIRYNNMLMIGVPDPVLSNQLKRVLTFLCKAVDITKGHRNHEGHNHQDFIDEDMVKEYAKFVDEYLAGSDERSLSDARCSVYHEFGPGRAKQLNRYLEVLKEEEKLEVFYEQHNIENFETHRLMKSLRQKFNDCDSED